MLHANEATRAIEGLRQHKPFALETAAKAICSVPESHPARDRLSSQIHWELMCAPRLIHREELHLLAGFGRLLRTRFSFLLRGQDFKPPLMRGGTTYRLQHEPQGHHRNPAAADQTRRAHVTAHHRSLPNPDANEEQLITVDWKPRSDEPEIVRFWNTATSTASREAVRLESLGHVIGVLDGGRILLTHSVREGQTFIAAVSDQGTLIAETTIEVVDSPDSKRRRRDVHNQFVVKELADKRFMISSVNERKTWSFQPHESSLPPVCE